MAARCLLFCTLAFSRDIEIPGDTATYRRWWWEVIPCLPGSYCGGRGFRTREGIKLPQMVENYTVII